MRDPLLLSGSAPLTCIDRTAPGRDRTVSRWTVAAIFAPLTVALLGGCSPREGGSAQAGGGGAAPVPVLVTTVESRTTAGAISTVGSLRSPETTAIAADVSGILVEIDLREGRAIAKGHLIARLDDSEARAAVQVAEAREKNARLILERVEPLVEDGVVPLQRLDDSIAEMRTAEGLLEEARTRLEKTRIRAPFAGVVGIQTAQLGQYVSSGDPIIELTRSDTLELVFSVPEERAGAVREGQQVRARVGRCGPSFIAVVEAIDPKIDTLSRTLAVQARVDNRERQLFPGMSARVRLAVGDEVERLVIAREALVGQATRYQVWTVDDDGTAQPRSVVPGQFLPAVVEIVTGLEVGETVVAAGHQKLRPGATVESSPWQPTGNPNLELGTRFEDDCPEDS